MAVRRSSSLRTGPSATVEEKENSTNGNMNDMASKKRSDSDRSVNQQVIADKNSTVQIANNFVARPRMERKRML